MSDREQRDDNNYNRNDNNFEKEQRSPSFKYIFKRRNASVGENINIFNKHLQEASSKSQSSVQLIHRTRIGGIESRRIFHRSKKNANFSHQSNNPIIYVIQQF
jgi:hypothetical protein